METLRSVRLEICGRTLVMSTYCSLVPRTHTPDEVSIGKALKYAPIKHRPIRQRTFVRERLT